MRIAHIINSLSIGGAEKLAVDSILHYKNKIDLVDLIVLKKTKINFQHVIHSNVSVTYLTDKSVYSPKLIFKLIPILKKYDIIHIHLFPALYWVVLAKILSFSKTKLVYTEHSTDNRRRQSSFFKLLDRYIYSKLDFIGCISQATKDNLIKHLNYKKDNISVIFNGLELDNFCDFNNNLKPTFDFFETDSFILIQVSSFRKQKDQKTVIRSLQYLPDSIKLLLVGEGELRKVNEQLVADLNLNNRVRFLGNRNDIPALMSFADICILSSVYEGFGLAVLEGMISKKPSIASDVSGLREIVNGYGLLFEQGNEKELASQILKLYQNHDLYKKVAQQCYDRALEFDIKKMVEHYTKAYEKLV